MKMKHFTIAAFAAIVPLFSAAPPVAAATFSASAKLTNPDPNKTIGASYSAASGGTVAVQLVATNMQVSVSGGTPNGTMVVQYTMHIQLDGEEPNGTDDTNANNPIVQISFDGNGVFKHPAFNTGNISGSVNKVEGPGYETPHDGDAISDIYDLNDPGDKTSAHYFHVDSHGVAWIYLKQ